MEWLKFVPIVNIFLAFYYTIKSLIDRTAAHYSPKVLLHALPCGIIGMGLLVLAGVLGASDILMKLFMFLWVYVVFLSIDWAFEK
jgi:hypothetical protein